MALNYGKRPRRSRKALRATSGPRSLRVRLCASSDLEQFSLDLQKMVARLQDGGVHGVKSCSLYLELLDESGSPIALHDAQGRAVETLDIRDG